MPTAEQKPAEKAAMRFTEEEFKKLEETNAALITENTALKSDVKFAEVTKENTALKEKVVSLEAKVVSFQEADAARAKADKIKRDGERFDSLVKSGHALPLQREGMLATFAEMSEASAQALTDTLAKAPCIVPMGKSNAAPAPAGGPDDARSGLRDKAVKFQEAHPGMAYRDALAAVAKE